MLLTMACSILLSKATTLAPEALSRQKPKSPVTRFHSKYQAGATEVLRRPRLFSPVSLDQSSRQFFLTSPSSPYKKVRFPTLASFTRAPPRVPKDQSGVLVQGRPEPAWPALGRFANNGVCD